MLDLAMPLKDWTVHNISGYCRGHSNNIFAFSISSQIPSLSAYPSLDSLPLFFNTWLECPTWATSFIPPSSWHVPISTFGSRPSYQAQRKRFLTWCMKITAFIYSGLYNHGSLSCTKSVLLSSATSWFPGHQTKVNKCFILPCAFF